MEIKNKRLTIIGNGFDLAHNLETSYGHFLFWYLNEIFEEYKIKRSYEDTLIVINELEPGSAQLAASFSVNSIESIFNVLEKNKGKIKYKNPFFRKLIINFVNNGWVDIEAYYFKYLKSVFNNTSIGVDDKRKIIFDLNEGFNYLIEKLKIYLTNINSTIDKTPIQFENPRLNLRNAFFSYDTSQVLFLNFNYTDTLQRKGYAHEFECLHIHGRVSDSINNPIIFGYGDESDPEYQKIEDSGENIYLEHMKSFGYFQTDLYQKLLSFIDTEPYDVFIVGHSCGLSDRILLNEIFEHNNCKSIHVFYHKKKDGKDNFKEITQEISRHFKPVNKNLMRRKVQSKDSKNIIPQLKN